MKVLHTSDWHLGKKLYKKSRHEEHCHFLSWLKETLLREAIDVLIIAGDVFDTARPPTNSLKLYFDFLNTVTAYPSLKQVLIIAGNHDSGHFLEAPQSFLAKQKIKVVGSYQVPRTLDQKEHDQWLERFTYDLTHENTTYRFALMPFFRVSDLVSHAMGTSGGEQLLEEELHKVLHLWQSNLRKNHHGPSMLVAHHLFGLFQAAGSEQTVSLSGLDSLAPQTFREWDVLALGHIHRKQVINRAEPLAIYSGSPLPMRFSESQHKSVVLYHHHKQQGCWHHEFLAIPQARLVARVTVDEKQWERQLNELKEQYHHLDLPPYLELTLRCQRLTVALVDQVRAGARDLNLHLLNIIPEHQQSDHAHEQEAPRELHLKDLFELSYDELFTQYLDHATFATPLSDQQKQRLHESFSELTQRHRDRVAKDAP